MDQGLRYSADIVFCIDATMSMRPVINEVKRAALKFHSDMTSVLDGLGKTVDELRVRVVVYRDFDVDGALALQESRFYALPDESAAFSAFINGIEALGGGDEPESGYEALARAIQSDWSTTSPKRRHVIVLWTDASSHPIEKANRSNPMYPKGIPANFDELYESWDGQSGMSMSAKRLVLFAPEHGSWAKIADNWDQVVFLPSKAGDGMSEIDYGTIIDNIAQSI